MASKFAEILCKYSQVENSYYTIGANLKDERKGEVNFVLLFPFVQHHYLD